MSVGYLSYMMAFDISRRGSRSALGTHFDTHANLEVAEPSLSIVFLCLFELFIVTAVEIVDFVQLLLHTRLLSDCAKSHGIRNKYT